MSKAKEISALYKDIKQQMGKLVSLCHEVEDHAEATEAHAEVTADAYQRGYEAGLNDAWDAARKVTQVRKYGGYGDCLGEVFGRHDTTWDVFDYSATEAIEKIRQYEQEKEEIKVGDEVVVRDKTAVVTEITDRYVRIMYSDGNSYALFSKGVVKTGRHFHEIAEVLQKMKES